MRHDQATTWLYTCLCKSGNMTTLVLLSSLIYCTTKAIELEPRIVYGLPIEASTYPWMVSLREVIDYAAYFDFYNYTTSDTMYESSFCGGSLIQLSPPIVLTAAHCVEGFGFNDTSGTFLTYDWNFTFPMYLYADINRTYPVNETGEPYQTLQITSESMIHIHGKWNTSDLGNGYDIALLIFEDGQNISGLSEDELPSLEHSLDDDEACCAHGDKLDVIGYGLDEHNGTSTDTLEYIMMHYVGMSQCKAAVVKLLDLYNFTIVGEDFFYHDQFVCVVGNNTDVCQGDSGGPVFNESGGNTTIYGMSLFITRNVQRHLFCMYLILWLPYVYSIIFHPAGVASFVIGTCNSHMGPNMTSQLPSVYTSVGHYHSWIEDTIDYVVNGVSAAPTTMYPTFEPTAPTIAPTTEAEEGDDRSGSALIASFCLCCIISCVVGVSL